MTGFKSKRQMAQAKTSMKDEALKQALEALEAAKELAGKYDAELEYGFQHVITAIKKALAQLEEQNFCSRCGKRTADLAAIHTCTPPRENT